MHRCKNKGKIQGKGSSAIKQRWLQRQEQAAITFAEGMRPLS